MTEVILLIRSSSAVIYFNLIHHDIWLVIDGNTAEVKMKDKISKIAEKTYN